MTTIAFDGKTLAADRQITSGSVRFANCRKITELKDGRFLASAGSISAIERVTQWLEGGSRKDEQPELEEGSFEAIVVGKGTTQYIDHELCLIDVVAPFAVGSGSNFAQMSMHLGNSAVAAVRHAAVFDILTGCEVDAVCVPTA
jgi:ATP-dependent protease HslVU (ClpYQ) peptidase subunit